MSEVSQSKEIREENKGCGFVWDGSKMGGIVSCAYIIQM